MHLQHAAVAGTCRHLHEATGRVRGINVYQPQVVAELEGLVLEPHQHVVRRRDAGRRVDGLHRDRDGAGGFSLATRARRAAIIGGDHDGVYTGEACRR